MARRLVLVVVLLGAVLAGAAASLHAEPGPAIWAEPDPAAVVGRWRATIAWRGCAATGAARAALDVERDGSGYAVDLAPVLDGLGPAVLVPMAAKKLEATRDDLHVAWTTAKPNRATLVVRFASGCTGTAALARETTGAPACDELAALEAVARRCDAVEAPEVSPADRATIAGARAARTRPAAARTCTRHAATLRASLVEVGCVPAPLPAAGAIRIPECESLVEAIGRLARCNKVPADAKQRLMNGMQRVARWSTIAPDGRADENLETARQLCVRTREELDELLTLMSC